ncbi:FAD-dependent oxidoreductase [Nocardioides sp. YIM 152588]|uniref:FAD-dependent oxidoreductase n=1 Tax=Nocardioides sp. YIM 152588 TaxID=3158259 RepID=UPI0032E49736
MAGGRGREPGREVGRARPRVVVAGLGDTGVLTAIHLSRRVDVVGISTAPALVSGQELGLRLARPEEWARDYWVEFGRFRRLDRVRAVHGEVTGLDRRRRLVHLTGADGRERAEPYDALVVSTGVSNGFWRRPVLQSADDVAADLERAHSELAAAGAVAVVGGGAAAVGSAYNLAARWPGKRVDLYYPGERALPSHHGRVWADVSRLLRERGVGLHPGHRAVVPATGADRITVGPVEFSTGQDPVGADAVLWAIGRVRPNSGWLPRELLDDDGFVRVGPTLQTADPRIFAVGDVAATDPLRSSARNRADRLVARNVHALLAGAELAEFRAPRHRWGSVLGYQPDGLRVYAPSGRPFRLGRFVVDQGLRPWVVRRGIYRGIRDG